MGWRGLTVAACLGVACGDASPGAGGSGGDASTTEAPTTGAADPSATSIAATSIADGTAGSEDGRASTGPEGTTAGADSTGVPVPPPPYPIVLAHGFFGFESFAGVDFIDYFWNVRERLAEEGEIEVFTPAVDPFNDSTTRGMQLLAQVETIVAETGAGKVNLIGHSQGGLDARLVASLRPDLVASVTTFATPHGGTRVADVTLGLVSDPAAQALVDGLVELAGAPFWPEIDGDTSLSASMAQLSTPGVEAFNEMYPDSRQVDYYSLTGRTGLLLGGADCQSDVAPDFVTAFEDERDPTETLLLGTYPIAAADLLDPDVNDGLVAAADAHWGTFLGCVPADHFDEIGQLFGDLPGITNAWRHEDFYAALVAWLRAEGY